MSGSSTDSTNPLPTHPHDPAQPHAPLNPINLCALCLSAPLRESKRQRARRRTASGNRSKAVMGGSGKGRDASGEEPHAPLNPMNLCALCLSAPLRESKTTTTRDSTNPLPSQPHDPSQPHAPLNPMNLCALCLSAPLRESKTTTRETPGSGAAAEASSIWYNVDGSSEQPSTAEQSGWRP